MGKLGKKEVRHVAKLARLELTDKEVEKFQRQLGEVLDYMEQLNEVDVAGVEPTAQTTGLSNVFSKDEIDASEVLSQKQAISGTDKTHNGYFVVPALLDKEAGG